MNQCLMLSPPYKPLPKLYPWPEYSPHLSPFPAPCSFPLLSQKGSPSGSPMEALSLRLGPRPQLPQAWNAPHAYPLVLTAWRSPASDSVLVLCVQQGKVRTECVSGQTDKPEPGSHPPAGSQQCSGTYQPVGQLEHRQHGYYMLQVVVQGRLKASPQHGEHQEPGRHAYPRRQQR